MQSACNTIPPPIDLALLEVPRIIASGPEPEIDHDLAMADLSVERPDPFPDTFSGNIARLISPERGAKLVRCKHGGFIFKFPDSSRGFRPSYPCHLTILCQECAMDQAIEQFAKYRSLAEFIPAEHFTRMTIRMDNNLPPAEAVDQIMELLDRALPTLPIVAKVKPSLDTIEIIYCGELTGDEVATIRAAYPTSHLHRWHATHFPRELHRVLDADIHATPESAVAADAKYNGIRILRVHGLSQEERKKLSLTTLTRDNFPEVSPEPSPGGGFSSSSDSSEDEFGPRTKNAPQISAIAPASTTPATRKQHYHRTSTGRLMPVPSCPCGCGAAPISFAAGKSKDDNSPDLNWIPINLVTEELVQ